MNPAYLIWTDPNGVTHWLGRGFRPGLCPLIDERLKRQGLAPDEWADYPAIPTCVFCVSFNAQGALR